MANDQKAQTGLRVFFKRGLKIALGATPSPRCGGGLSHEGVTLVGEGELLGHRAVGVSHPYCVPERDLFAGLFAD